MHRSTRSGSLIVISLLSALALARADEVILKNGGAIQGRIISEDAQQVVIETKAGPVTIARARVKEVVRSQGPRQPEPAPVTPAPVTPAPVTPAPVTTPLTPGFVEHRSRHYTLLTDIPELEVRPVLRFIDAMHDTFNDMFSGEPVREVSPPIVRVFARIEDYAAYGRANEAAFNENWRGYFSRDRNELVSHRGPTLLDLNGILSHEGFHQFVWARVRPPTADELPDWLEEGLADHFRSDAVQGKRLAHRFQRHHAERVQRAIREGSVWTQEQLWTTDPGALSDPARFDSFYAHAYMYVRFLTQTNRRAVLEVYELKRAGRASAEILAAVFPPARRARLHEAFLAFAQDPR